MFGYNCVHRVCGRAGRWDYVYVDSANHRLYVSHQTQVEVIDTTNDKVVGTITGTGGVHGIALAGETSPGKFEVVATIPKQKSARTIGSDQAAHKPYLPAAELGPPAEGKDGKKGRLQALPDSFSILVVGR